MRALRTLGAALSIALFALPLTAAAEEISVFRTALTVQHDGGVLVSEQITYDFGGVERHGIYRDIQLSYKDALGGTEQIAISDISVTDSNDVPYEFTASESGGYEHIKIGDPGVFVTGTKIYRITYMVRGAIGYFADHDELYWNVTGDQWQVPIKEAQAVVWIPKTPTSYACYAGARGSTSPCQSADSRLDGTGQPIVVFSSIALRAGEGLTVAVGQPKGVIAEPSAAERYEQLLKANLPIALPFVVLIIMGALWWRYGKDARGRGTIIPEYDAPADLSPFEISDIVSEKIAPAAFSAAIIELAVRGYLTIERVDTKTLGFFSTTDYRFRKVKNVSPDAHPDDAAVMKLLFSDDRAEILASDLKGDRTFSTGFTALKTAVEKRLVADGYYKARPSTVRSAYVTGGLIVLGVAVGYFSDMLTPVVLIAIAVSAIIVILFGLIMPAKTEKGARLREQILGLKEYLQIAEKNRLDFHNAPERTTALFEKLLPAAMVLGVSTAWAKEFEGIYKEPPRWFVGAYPNFTPTAFASDMKSFSTAAAALAMPAGGAGGAGGGGFSGGGFGGGGGGSW